jgi:arsenite-transporting ATPase
LFACNLDPEAAAKAYREKVVGPYRGKLPDSVVASMEEQLSGACTVEIAAFDEFTNLLTNLDTLNQFDHVIFDTAPTGHTLRLLQLPTAWTQFLNESTHGASCLGPLSGLAEKKELYAKTVDALSDSQQTTLILVSRPDPSALQEAARASKELQEIGIRNQLLVINGKLITKTANDAVSEALYQRQQKALEQIPTELTSIPSYELPLVSQRLTGISDIKNIFNVGNDGVTESLVKPNLHFSRFSDVIDDFFRKNTRIIFTMGKGGVGKTTLASAIALGLAERGQRVHLTTTDPASHLHHIFEGNTFYQQLTISRIDPKKEVEKYREEVLNKAAESLDEHGIEYLKEDLNSPCTEEIAVFRAFAEVVAKSENEVVVIDTAPTGHTLLLLDAAQAYHKELARSTGEVPESVKQLLPRLRNPKETEVVIVTLPEVTPVLEAERLQEDLKRANIHPSWWVINQSFYATETKDPILQGKAQTEIDWIQKVSEELAEKAALIPWLAVEKVDIQTLIQMMK